MICYAIKNDKSEYFGIDRDGQWYWEDRIECAYFFQNIDKSDDESLAKNFRDNHFSKYKIVKIEIKEIQDGKINN